MGFFDTLGKKATEAYNVTTKKTGELAKEAKLRMKIKFYKSRKIKFSAFYSIIRQIF